MLVYYYSSMITYKQFTYSLAYRMALNREFCLYSIFEFCSYGYFGTV